MTDVSVIVPVYNVSPYIERCVKSLLKQTFIDYEILLVDDGSTDESGAICDLLARNNDNIRVIHQENTGPSRARNTGILAAKGKYVMFCDADDTVEQDWIKAHVKLLNQYPDALVVSGCRICDENGNVIEEQHCNEVLQVMKPTDYFVLFEHGVSAYPINKIYRLDVLKKYEIRFPEDIRHGEDVIFNLDYLKHCTSMVTTSNIYYNYVKYSSRQQLTKSEYALSDTLVIYRKRKEAVDSKDLYKLQIHYWRIFSEILDNSLRHTNESIYRRIKSGKEVIRTPEYQELLAIFGKQEMHRIAYYYLKHKNLLGYWAVMRLYTFKRRLVIGSND